MPFYALACVLWINIEIVSGSLCMLVYFTHTHTHTHTHARAHAGMGARTNLK